MLYREDSRGISRIWRRRRRTAANPGDVSPCCVGCHGMGLLLQLSRDSCKPRGPRGHVSPVLYRIVTGWYIVTVVMGWDYYMQSTSVIFRVVTGYCPKAVIVTGWDSYLSSCWKKFIHVGLFLKLQSSVMWAKSLKQNADFLVAVYRCTDPQRSVN